MNILITGANFNNKGAQLMLESIIFSINKRIPNAKIFVSPILGNDKGISALGIQKLDFPLFHYGNDKFFKFSLTSPTITKLLLKLKNKPVKGTVNIRDINVVFDISGFAFGDKWGAAPLANLSYFVKKMKKQGTKFILFPQAFGPFEAKGMENNIKNVATDADLLITRDKQSHQYVLNAVTGQKTNVKLYPDITLTFDKKIKISDPLFQKPFAAIVPNERMLDKASARWMKEYVETMRNVVKTIINNSELNVIMLIHAQGDSADAKVGKDILHSLTPAEMTRIIYFVEEDPVRLKSLISGAKFIVGSRFHALASALSSNVPSIGTSWLHKYEMLFEDYNVSEYSFPEPDSDIFEKVKTLLDNKENLLIREKLAVVNSTVEAKSESMWTEILEVIN